MVKRFEIIALFSSLGFFLFAQEVNNTQITFNLNIPDDLFGYLVKFVFSGATGGCISLGLRSVSGQSHGKRFLHILKYLIICVLFIIYLFVGGRACLVDSDYISTLLDILLLFLPCSTIVLLIKPKSEIININSSESIAQDGKGNTAVNGDDNSIAQDVSVAKGVGNTSIQGQNNTVAKSETIQIGILNINPKENDNK